MMRLIHPRDKCLYDIKNIEPIHLLEDPLDEQNDLTLGFKTNNYSLRISSPGYHQTKLIPLVNFDIINSFCDFHYDSTEKKKDIILRPKFGSYPIQLLIYPLQDMNFKFLYNSDLDLSNEFKKRILYEVKVDSFKKKIKMAPSLIVSLAPLNFSLSSCVSLTHLKPQILYKLSWTVGSRPFYAGTSYFIDKNDNDVYEFAARYDDEIFDFRFFVSHPTNKNIYDIKSSLEYQKSYYRIFVSSNLDNFGRFKVSSKCAYNQKTLDLGFDSSKKLKCFFDTQLKGYINARIGMTINPDVSFNRPPLFKASIIFNKSD